MPPVTFQFLAVIILSFAYGLLVGATLGPLVRVFRPAEKRAAVFVGHTDPMPTPEARRRRDRFLLVMVGFAILLSALAGFLYVFDASKDSERVRCGAAYNVQDGLARDERDRVMRRQTRTELEVWQDLRDQLARPTGPTTRDLVRTVKVQIKALRKLQNTRAANPYPEPTMCGDGRD